MSKSKKPTKYEAGWDEEEAQDAAQKNNERRKQKRLINVLRSRDINQLMKLEEDDEDE